MSKEQNPANEQEKFVVPKDFIPMSAPVQRLQAPERPGYHRHWFRGTPERLAQARRAYYDFVHDEDVDLNELGASGAEGGDMGTRVSRIDGEEVGRDGQPARLYLMECRQELFDLSQKLIEEHNEKIASALRGGKIGAGEVPGETPGDMQRRYAKGQFPDLFIPKRRKSG